MSWCIGSASNYKCDCCGSDLEIQNILYSRIFIIFKILSIQTGYYLNKQYFEFEFDLH